ncbi:MAG: hypothetical protein QNI99_00320 [Woeseiaceae bacterium]|nr:hypothetical protein [Woeseiaceae bacterium]
MNSPTTNPVRAFVPAAIAIAASSLFLSTAVAQEDTACQRRVDSIKEQTLRFAEGVEERHDRELSSILSSYERRNVDPVYRAAAEASVSRILERNDVEEMRTSLIERPIEEYRYTFRNASNANACPPARWIRGFFRAYLNHYELSLETVRDEVSNRLSLDQLQSDEGLLIVAYDSDWGANTVSINRLGAMGGGIRFTAPLDGQLFRIMPAKAGEYRWEEISKDVMGGRRVLVLDKVDLRFTVEAGRINYIGAFLVNESPRYMTASMHQRTSMVMSQAFDLYPEVLSRFEIVNAVDPDDPFLPFYLAEHQRAAMPTEMHNDAQ